MVDLNPLIDWYVGNEVGIITGDSTLFDRATGTEYTPVTVGLRGEIFRAVPDSLAELDYRPPFEIAVALDIRTAGQLVDALYASAADRGIVGALTAATVRAAADRERAHQREDDQS